MELCVDERWVEKTLPGFTNRDRRTEQRAATPMWSTYEMEAKLTNGHFYFIASRLTSASKVSGIQVSFNGQIVGSAEFKVSQHDHYSSGIYRGQHYTLEAEIEVPGATDISQLELQYLAVA